MAEKDSQNIGILAQWLIKRLAKHNLNDPVSRARYRLRVLGSGVLKKYLTVVILAVQ